MTGPEVQFEVIWSGALHRAGLTFDLSGYGSGPERSTASRGAHAKYVVSIGRRRLIRNMPAEAQTLEEQREQ